MAQLQVLPSELLLAIASHVPELRDLACSYRRVNQVVTPLLYESVFYRQEWIQVVSRGSQIYNLDAFNRSLRSSESLRSLVKSVDLRWHNMYKDVDDDVRRCLQVLESSCLQALHLSPANLSFEIPAGLGFTSLAYEGGEKIDCGKGLDRLYTLFCIPSLTHFYMDQWFWEMNPVFGAERVDQGRVGTSNIETLTLEHTWISASDLQRLLSWPKTLKTLTFHGESITSLELHHSLQHQRLTLEYLDTRATYARDIRSDIFNPVILRTFPALKYLRIEADLLIVPLDEYEDYHANRPPSWAIVPRHSIVDALPPALEELVLDPRWMFQKCKLGDALYSKRRGDLMGWLQDIAASKPTAFPSLAKVRLSHSRFTPEEMDQRVISRYEEAGIQLHTDPPSRAEDDFSEDDFSDQ